MFTVASLPSLSYDMCLRETLLLNCCFLLCRGDIRPMDLVSVTTSPALSQNGRPSPPRRLFSFLSVAWGFVSDVDIESERCVRFASLSQVAERLGNWASNPKIAGSIPGCAK